MNRIIVNRIVAVLCLVLGLSGMVLAFLGNYRASGPAWILAFIALLWNRGFGDLV